LRKRKGTAVADQQTQDQTNQASKQQDSRTSDAPGKLAGDRGDAKAQPSGYRGNNPATAGSGETHVESSTPDNAVQQLNPSAPANTGTTPGTNAKVG
jgi:hypothetical protein